MSTKDTTITTIIWRAAANLWRSNFHGLHLSNFIDEEQS